MNKITCDLCPRFCSLSENKVGFCNGRKAQMGKIIPINYGEILSMSLDPIEKKPIQFYKNNSMILSVGTFGCNMNCQFCQNYEIARAKESDYPTRKILPEQLINIAIDNKRLGNIGIAFTYNEPLIGYEYILDVAKLSEKEDLDIVIVSNGQINEKYLRELIPYVAAWNIDLKAFSEENYKKLGGDFKTTLRSIEMISLKSHLEITTLVVPGISDDLELFKKQVEFIGNLDENILLHLTRYIPRYKYTLPPTSIELLNEMKEIAKKHLKNVVLGNI